MKVKKSNPWAAVFKQMIVSDYNNKSRGFLGDWFTEREKRTNLTSFVCDSINMASEMIYLWGKTK